MKRPLYRATLIPYLAAMAAVAVLWLRSYRALDQLYGRALGRGFDINSFNGQCQIRVTTQYQIRAGLYPKGPIENYPRPFDVLERDTSFDRPGFVVRQRWPLKDTTYWEADPVRFPRPDYRRWLAFARDGPGRYTWVDLVIVPYWLVIVAAAAPMLVPVPGAVRRRRRTRAGLCAACGYDTRATPGRCPECGRTQPTAVPGR
jgi:hypothetical protein